MPAHSGPIDNAAGNDAVVLPPDSPFFNLNAIVLSIEWEITDEIMANFMGEIDGLMEKVEKNKGLYSFLQLHSSIGKYIQAKKSDAHPESIRLLHSVHNGLLNVLSNTKITAQEKNEVLAGEIHKFNLLKNHIIEDRAKGLEKPTAPVVHAEGIEPPAGPGLPEDMARALEEIKDFLKNELRLLRDEVRSLKKEK